MCVSLWAAPVPGARSGPPQIRALCLVVEMLASDLSHVFCSSIFFLFLIFSLCVVVVVFLWFHRFSRFRLSGFRAISLYLSGLILLTSAVL